MNILPPGVLPALGPDAAGPTQDAPAPVAPEKPTAPSAEADGLQRAESPISEKVFGPAQANKLFQDPRTASGVAAAEVVRELSGGKMAAESRFASLNPAVKERMLEALVNGPPFLGETFKRLVNSPAFLKVRAEVQEKVIALLAKAADAKHGALIEKLVRSPAFTKLPEREQAKILAGLTNGPEASKAGEDAPRASDDFGPSTIRIPVGGEAVAVNTLIQLALMIDPGGVRLDDADPLPVDREGAGAGDAREAGAAYLEMKRTLTALRELGSFTPPEVEVVIGAELRPIAGGPEPMWRARPAEGVFGRVTLHETAAGVRLALDVRPGVAVGYEQCREDLFGEPLLPPARGAKGGGDELVFSLADTALAQEIALAFDRRSARLVSVELERAAGFAD
jgi:hypothetical protein